MNILKQLRLTNYLFAFIIFVISCVGIGIGFFASTLITRQKWVDRTNEASAEMKLCKSTLDATNIVARNRVLTGFTPPEFAALQARSRNCLSELKTKVADNANQIALIESIEKESELRFKAQEAQFESVKRDNGTISYNAEQVTETIRQTSQIEDYFHKMEMNEIDLLRFDRMPRLAVWQWRIVYLGLTLLIFLIGVLCFYHAIHRKLLKRLVSLSNQMEGFIHKTEGDAITQKELGTFHVFVKDIRTYIQGDSDELPNT